MKCIISELRDSEHLKLRLEVGVVEEMKISECVHGFLVKLDANLTNNFRIRRYPITQLSQGTDNINLKI